MCGQQRLLLADTTGEGTAIALQRADARAAEHARPLSASGDGGEGSGSARVCE